MLKWFNKEIHFQLAPYHDSTFVKTIAQQKILQYRVRLLSGINYARLLFAGFILWYFYAVVENHPTLNIFFDSNKRPYDHLQLFWVTLSGYVLLLLFCNTALLYKTTWRWIFLIMAWIEVGVLATLLTLVFDQELVTVTMMLILCSILLSALTLTYIESILFAIVTGGALLFYLLITNLSSQVIILKANGNGVWKNPTLLWSLLKEHQLEVINAIIYAACLLLIIIMVGFLASQARENKILSRLNHYYNSQLRKLNDSIIEDIKSGLIVVNAEGIILTLNQQAKKIFNLQQKKSPPKLLMNLSAALAKHFNRWLYSQFSDARNIDIGRTSYSVEFDTLKQHLETDLTLITIESVDESMHRIREARLVSLGRLSAGIAHEIRNPLASIQSAADLLYEQSSQQDSLFLLKKITQNTKRINVIISDVLSMFNEQAQERKLVHLNSELLKIIKKIQQDALTKEATIQLKLQQTQPYYVHFDTGHLAQIINNLIMNSLIHGGRDNIIVTITGQVSNIGRQIYLDISDNGQGVETSDQEKLFEPFFSRRNGTGLGLYLIREMCLANQAQIVFLRQSQGARFRITMERYLNSE